MDFGYPQNCAIDLLRLYINLGMVRQTKEEDKDAGQLTSQITGIVDWFDDHWLFKYRIVLYLHSTGDVKGFVIAKMKYTSMSTNP